MNNETKDLLIKLVAVIKNGDEQKASEAIVSAYALGKLDGEIELRSKFGSMFLK